MSDTFIESIKKQVSYLPDEIVNELLAVFQAEQQKRKPGNKGG